MGDYSVALAEDRFVLGDKKDMRVIILVCHRVTLALLLELLILHRRQIAEQIFLLSACLQRRLIPLDKDAAARPLLHRLQAGALRPNDHPNEVDRVVLGDLDALLEELGVLQEAIDIWEHARAPMIVVWRCIRTKSIALSDKFVVKGKVLSRLVRLR